MDDHEIVRMTQTIHENGYIKSVVLWILGDINLRFRPVYWIFRVSESFLLRNHVNLWHIAKAAEIGLCSYLIYYFSKKMQNNALVSLIFVILHFWGEQCKIIFRLGPQEPLALIWLFLSLICCIYCSERITNFRMICLTVSLILMMLTKEAFLLLLPVVLLFLCYLDWKKEKDLTWKIFFKPIKKYKYLFIINLFIFTLCLLFIIFFCGTDSIGYAGFSFKDEISSYFVWILNIWKHNLKIYLILSFLSFVLSFVGLIFTIKNNKLQKRILIFLFCCEAVFLIYFIIVQSMIHAKSGMSERYLLPCISGILIYCFIFAVNYFKFNKNINYLYKLFLIAFSLIIISRTNIYKESCSYALECIYNMQLLDKTSNIVNEYGDKNIPIIVSTERGEWNLAISTFLQEMYGINNVYSFTKQNNMAQDRYIVGEGEKKDISIEDACIFISYTEFLSNVLEQRGLMEYMNETVVGNYIIYNKDFSMSK